MVGALRIAMHAIFFGLKRAHHGTLWNPDLVDEVDPIDEALLEFEDDEQT
jgi:hypothetical protein